MRYHQGVNHFMLRWTLGELRDGFFVSIVAALILIVASVFLFASLADRTEQMIRHQTHEALLGDAVFESANQPPQQLDQLISEFQLVSSSMTRFSTMAFSDAGMTLVMVKAVDTRFPLKGVLDLSNEQGIQARVQPGDVWLDKSLFPLLSVHMGDSIAIGDFEAKITGEIEQEPGFNFNPFRQIPTVFIHQRDIGKTGALQQGSRVSYIKYINGPAPQLRKLKDALLLSASERWVTLRQSDRIGVLFGHTSQYLSIVVIAVLLMASLTLVLTCQNYVESRSQTIAMLKSLGATKGWIVRWLMIQIGLMFSVAIFLGLLLGMGLDVVIRIPLADLLPDSVAPIGVMPFLISVITCCVIAVPALLIPLSRFVGIRAVAVMQPVVAPSGRKPWYLLVLPFGALVAYFGSETMIWYVFAGMIGLFVVLAVVSLLLIRFIRQFAKSATFKLALNRLHHSAIASGLQFGALALSLMLIATLWLVHKDLLSDWRDIFPPNAPNIFAFNISPEDTSAYLAKLEHLSLEHSPVFPIVRGRLTQINGTPAKRYTPEAKTHNALNRELNFTWRELLPTYNQVVKGTWTATGGVSVEMQVAQALNIQIGDTLTFTINSVQVQATVNSLRQVEWRDMKPNFFFIFTPDVLKGMPETGLVSFLVPDERNISLSQLTSAFPTVSVIDLRKIISNIQRLLGKIVWIVSFMALLAMTAGLLLIFTLLRLSLLERAKEIHLYRILGASQKCIVSTLWAEFGIMAIVGGLLAGIAADGVTALLIFYGLSLPSTLHLYMWILLPAMSAGLLFLVVRSMLSLLMKTR